MVWRVTEKLIGIGIMFESPVDKQMDRLRSQLNIILFHYQTGVLTGVNANGDTIKFCDSYITWETE